MKLKIVSTTDGQFVGQEVNLDSSIQRVVGRTFSFSYDRTVSLPDGVRFISSNYIIDTVEQS
jgi:hypothetical protein